MADPKYRRGNDTGQLPKGQAAAANAASESFPDPTSVPGRFVEPEPVSPQQNAPAAPEDAGDRNLGELNDFLLAETDRPEEPITAGMPFGHGPNYVRRAGEDDNAAMRRVAVTLANDPNASDRVRAFAQRVLRES